MRSLRLNLLGMEIADAEGGDVQGGTVNGDIIVRNLKVRTLDLHSVSGDMRLADVETDRATMRSINGDIEYAGRLARTGRYEFNSNSGDIRVTPASDTGFDIEANSFSGSVRSDYAVKINEGRGQGFQRGLNRMIRGSSGNGGAALILQSFSGDITILKR